MSKEREEALWKAFEDGEIDEYDLEVAFDNSVAYNSFGDAMLLVRDSIYQTNLVY